MEQGTTLFNNVTEQKIHFITQGIQYYVVGRFARLKLTGAFHNVSTILFHHVIEFFLKAALSDHYTLKTLKNKRHDLPSLVKLYKIKFPESQVIDNIKFINDFHKIYKTRYVEADGSHRIGFTSYSLTRTKRNTATFKGKRIKFDLEFSLEEIDEVIYNICRDIELHPTTIFEYIKHIVKDCPEFYEHNAFFIKTTNKRNY